MNIDIYFDGACRNEKGAEYPMGIGVVAFDSNGKVLMETARNVTSYHGHTNNIAEWLGLVQAMETIQAILDHYGALGRVKIYTDSQLICNQYNGEWLIKDKKFGQYMKQAKMHEAELVGTGVEDITLQWVRRERNTYADKLSKEGTGFNVFRVQKQFSI